MNTKRSGIENLFNKVVVPIISDEKEQADCDSHAINVLEHEIAIELYKHLKEEPLAIRVMPIVKSNVSYGFNEGEREIRASVQFRKFTFCGDCSFFSQDGFNGGYCMKMRDVVHITDGCEGCKYQDKESWEMPCSDCKNTHVSHWKGADYEKQAD